MCEFLRVSETRNQRFDSRGVLRRRNPLERVMIAIERLGQRRRRYVGPFNRVDRSAKLRRHDLGAFNRLRSAAGDLKRGLVGRVNGAEEVGWRNARLLDAPEQSVAVD